MQRKSWLLATACAGFVVLGCGDDDGGGSVSGASRVNDLTVGEREALCKDFAGKFGKLAAAAHKVECTGEGLASEVQDPGSCEEARSACLADSEPDAEFSCDDDPEEATGGEDCDATVAQLEACFDAWVSIAEELANDFTCEGSEELEEIEEPEVPEACTDLQDACPEINFME